MKLSEEEIGLFNDSLDRCVSNPRFLDDFYELFIGSSIEIAQKFAATKMEHQKRALKASLYTALLAADDNEPAIEHLQRLASHHSALEIRSEHYDRWVECLITVVKSCDDLHDVQIDRVWRTVLATAVGLVSART